MKVKLYSYTSETGQVIEASSRAFIVAWYTIREKCQKLGLKSPPMNEVKFVRELKEEETITMIKNSL